jgi:hypothetical protein
VIEEVSELPVLFDQYYPSMPLLPRDMIVWSIEDILGDTLSNAIACAVVTACIRSGEWRAVSVKEVLAVLNQQESGISDDQKFQFALANMASSRNVDLVLFQNQTHLVPSYIMAEKVLKSIWVPLSTQ